jgi:hypothetical protein
MNKYPHLLMSADMFLHALLIIAIAYLINLAVVGWLGSLILFCSVFAGIGLAYYSGENENVGLRVFRRFLKEE